MDFFYVYTCLWLFNSLDIRKIFFPHDLDVLLLPSCFWFWAQIARENRIDVFYPSGGCNKVGETGMSSDTRKQSKGIRDPCCRRQCQVFRKGTVKKPMEYRFRKLGEHRAVKLREEQALFLGSTCRKKGMKWWQGRGNMERQAGSGVTMVIVSPSRSRCVAIMSVYLILSSVLLSLSLWWAIMGPWWICVFLSFSLSSCFWKAFRKLSASVEHLAGARESSPDSAHGGLKLCKVSLCLFC